MRIKFYPFAILVAFIIIIYRDWFFSFGTLSSGDWPYFYQSAVREFSSGIGYYIGRWGLGETKLLFASLETYFQQTARLFWQFLPWEITERLFWFFPFLFFSIFSSYKLTKSFIGSLIYTTNTYILMVVSGGQMGVAMAYAVAPLPLYFLSELTSKNVFSSLRTMQANYSKLFFLVISLALLIHFDPRIAFIMLFVLFSYLFFIFIIDRKRISFLIRSLSVSLASVVFALLLHSFWILPMVRYGVGPSDHDNPANFSAGSVQFFSFSDFAHSLSLLHPNWPENLFGKVYFMQPEFLLLPLLAFLPLLFLQNTSFKFVGERHKLYFFLALLWLIGAFLAKGASEPFGQLYLFLFRFIPGFVVFRDPTKFYIVIALAYSFLIPYSLDSISENVGKFARLKIAPRRIAIGTLFIFTIIWGILIRQSLTGEVKGTLQAALVPQEYRDLERYLASDTKFSRVMWLPVPQRFGYYSNLHPAVSASEYFQTTSISALLSKIKSKQQIDDLHNASVRYLIVPTDPKGEIFLEDRRYSEKKYKDIVSAVNKITLLKKIATFGGINVYDLGQARLHFWINNKHASVSYKSYSPTSYHVSIRNASPGDMLLFTDAFSRFWRVKEDGKTMLTTESVSGLNVIPLSKNESKTVEVFHLFDSTMGVGVFLSGLAFLLLLSPFLFFRKFL